MTDSVRVSSYAKGRARCSTQRQLDSVDEVSTGLEFTMKQEKERLMTDRGLGLSELSQVDEAEQPPRVGEGADRATGRATDEASALC